jgi:hypothetical protein
VDEKGLENFVGFPAEGEKLGGMGGVFEGKRGEIAKGYVGGHLDGGTQLGKEGLRKRFFE